MDKSEGKRPICEPIEQIPNFKKSKYKGKKFKSRGKRPSEQVDLEKIKALVWVVKFSPLKYFGAAPTFGTAFSIDHKLLFTVCDYFPNDFQQYKLEVRRLTDTNFIEAEVVYRVASFDMALLTNPAPRHDLKDGIRFADELELSEGQELIHIGNPYSLFGSVFFGRVAYKCPKVVQLPKLDQKKCATYACLAALGNPPCRIVGNIWNQMELDQPLYTNVDLTFVKQLHPAIPLIQLYGFACESGCWGGPVLTKDGSLVGMMAKIRYRPGFPVAIHVQMLKEFLRLYYQKRSPVSSSIQSTPSNRFSALRETKKAKKGKSKRESL